MPETGEICRRLSAVEQAISSHTAECVVRNDDMREWRKATHDDVQALKLDRAKFVGIAIAVSTIASALGSGGMLALFRVLGK